MRELKGSLIALYHIFCPCRKNTALWNAFFVKFSKYFSNFPVKLFLNEKIYDIIEENSFGKDPNGRF